MFCFIVYGYFEENYSSFLRQLEIKLNAELTNVAFSSNNVLAISIFRVLEND